MSAKIVALTGISGVGKTTFLERLKEHLVFQHLTGGSLIAAARDHEAPKRDELRYADLDENQRLLIHGFALARDLAAEIVILDGHVVIDTDTGLTKLPTNVFRQLGVASMVHLETDPARIAANRAGDNARERPIYDIDTLAAQQEASREHAKKIAAELDIDLHLVKHGHVELLASILRKASQSPRP